MPWAGPRTASSRATGTRAGRALRQATLDRDGHQCTHTLPDGTRCPEAATQADHVVPVHKGGPSVLPNMASLCLPHHKVKIAAEAAGARPTARRPVEPHPGLIG
jgi:5-methylcytosine-specific restriction endonuclease McrA